MSRQDRHLHRQGMSLVYMTVAMTALAGVCALAVDVGRVRLVKAELSCAADAAARAAASKLASTGSTAAARAEAVAVAGYHTADGSTVVVQSADVAFGKWDAATRTLDTTSPAPDAVHVTAARTTARGNAVPTTFAQLVGAAPADLTLTSVANATVTPPQGLAGLAGVGVHNNLLVASYDSSVTTNPVVGNANSKALVISNGVVSGHNNNQVRGDILLGPGGSFSGVNRTGSTISRSAAIARPASPAWSPGSNPNSTPQAYSPGAGTTTLPGGTYWFTSLAVNGTLSFSGAATVYLNGNATLSGTLRAYNGVPANLKIYQIGSRTFGNANGNHIDVTADISAPHSVFQAKNNLTFRGRMLFDTIEVHNNATFFYDESLGTALGSTSVTTVR